jgi:hypothetical protein
MSTLGRFACAVLSAVVAWVPLAACTRQNAPSGTESGRPAVDAAFAYVSDQELGLVRDGQVVARVKGNFFHILPPQFSVDGRFVFAAQGGDQLGVIDLVTRKARTVPTPGAAGKVAPYRGTNVVWTNAAGDELTSLDLGPDQPVPSPATKLQFPAPDVSGGVTPIDVLQARLVGSSGKALIFARLDHKPGTCLGPDNLYLLRDGAVSSLGRASGCTPVMRVAFSRDGEQIAYANEPRMCDQASVTIRAVADGVPQTSGVQADEGGVRSMVPRLWWDEHGVLSVGYASWRCAGGGLAPLESPSVWAHTEGGWSRQPTVPALQILSFPSGSTAVLSPNDGSQDSLDKGALWIVAGSNRTHIADNVSDLAALPVSSPSDS